MSVDRARADLDRLTAEIAQLQQRIRDAEGQATKIRAYLEMAAVYGEVASPVRVRHFTQDAAPARGGPREAGVGVSHESVELAVAYLKEVGRPTHTRDILKYVETHGLKIGGKDPVANLSGFLSRSGLMVSSRKDGWSLKEWTAAAKIAFAPPDAEEAEMISDLEDEWMRERGEP